MLKVYVKRFKMEAARGKEYFFSFLSTLLYMPISLLIYYFLFRYVLQSGAGFPMTLPQILSYYTVVLFMKSAFQHSMTEVYDVFQEINGGLLDLRLTKPASYLLVRYSRALGSVAVTLSVSLLILALFFWNRYPLGNVICFFLLVWMGFTLLFLVMFFLGRLTFWLKSVLTLRDIFWFVLSIFSGELIPLRLFPAAYRFLRYNPLACIYDIPYQVLNARSRLPLLGVQAAYLLLFWLLAAGTWRRGLKHYESQGG